MSPLGRSAPLRRRTGLATRAPLRSVRPLGSGGSWGRRAALPARSSRVRPRSEKGDAYQAEFRSLFTAIHRRASGLCELRIPGVCTRTPERAPHHRWLRSRGGPNTRANLVAVCRPCHDYAHRHRTQARASGWIIDSKSERQDPVSAPVLRAGRWWQPK